VEGQSELMALPAFADAISTNLARDGISIVSADGNRFAYLLRSFSKSGFGIPSVTVFDSDSFRQGNVLLRVASSAGVIDATEMAIAKNASIPDRVKLLEGKGWIAALENFEEEVCGAGYSQEVAAVIDAEGAGPKLAAYLRSNGLSANPRGYSRFINSEDGKYLKIPVALAIANAVKSKKIVPRCYSDAIARAISLAN
jgi:hypothetical protein